MSSDERPRRAYGTGSLEIRKDKHGRETYYARFYAGRRQVRRKLGLKRQLAGKVGLTKPAAERALQKLIDEQVRLVPVAERVDLETAGERYILHLSEVMQRKPSTIQDYEIMLCKHLVPFFGNRAMERIDTHLVSEYLLFKQREGLASKTVGNQLTFLHGLFRHAMKKSWVYANPVAAVDRPRDPETDADIRFLTHEEVEALLRATTGRPCSVPMTTSSSAHPVLGSVLDASNLRKRFKDTLARAQVRPVRFHDLRHTFGTQAAAAGVPLRTLQEWMGHRDYKTTLIYADYAPRTHEKSLMGRAFSPAPPFPPAGQPTPYGPDHIEGT